MYDIVVCLPSYNEADRIAHVVRQVDQGLRTYFPALRAVIVNADNNSTDGTSSVFESTPSVTPKLCLPAAENRIGKGENLKNFFRFAAQMSARAGACFDADLESIAPEWIPAVISPLFNDFDFVFPVYSRFRYDGAITSQLCYPVLTGVYGVSIRQPIGGDFGFSGDFLKLLAADPIAGKSARFGVDIHLTLQAVKRGRPCCGVALGRKIHRKRDRATLGPMFCDVASSLFTDIAEDPALPIELREIREPLVLQDHPPVEACPPVPVDLAVLQELFCRGVVEHQRLLQQVMPSEEMGVLREMALRRAALCIDASRWSELVYRALSAVIQNTASPDDAAQALEPVFFGRVASFVAQTRELDDAAAEETISKLARLFFQKRGMLFAR